MEEKLIGLLIQSGSGTLLAAIVLYFHFQWLKRVDEQNRDDRKRSEETIAKLGNEFRETVEANTKAITMLCTLVEASSDRRVRAHAN